MQQWGGGVTVLWDYANPPQTPQNENIARGFSLMQISAAAASEMKPDPQPRQSYLRGLYVDFYYSPKWEEELETEGLRGTGTQKFSRFNCPVNVRNSKLS